MATSMTLPLFMKIFPSETSATKIVPCYMLRKGDFLIGKIQTNIIYVRRRKTHNPLYFVNYSVINECSF